MSISDWSSDVCSSDRVTFGLRLVQRFHRLLAAHAAGLDLRLGLALLGDQLLQARFLLRQPLAQRGKLGIESAVFERLPLGVADRSDEHTYELQSLMRISYAVFCLKQKKQHILHNNKQVTELLLEIP